MAKYTAKPLRALDRLYRFVGGLSTSGRVDLESPITLVHDVSRNADLASIDGEFGALTANVSPYFTINRELETAGADSETEVLGIYSNQPTTWALNTWIPPDPLSETVWFLGAHAACLAPTPLNSALVGLQIDPKASAGGGFQPQVLVWRGSTGLFPGLLNGENLILPDYSHEGPPIPISNKLLNNTPIVIGIDSSNSLTVNFYIRCLRLPNGVLPPGAY